MALTTGTVQTVCEIQDFIKHVDAIMDTVVCPEAWEAVFQIRIRLYDRILFSSCSNPLKNQFSDDDDDFDYNDERRERMHKEHLQTVREKLALRQRDFEAYSKQVDCTGKRNARRWAAPTHSLSEILLDMQNNPRQFVPASDRRAWERTGTGQFWD